jgi:hypothetical protein
MNKSSNYFIDEDENGLGRCMVVSGPWKDEYRVAAEKEGAAVLRLSSGAGWSGSDISFIKDLHFLEGIEVFNFNVNDVSPIFDLSQLRYVGLQCKFKSPTRFRALGRLEICKIFWDGRASDLLGCPTLRHLNVVNFPYVDLASLALLGQMRKLQIASKKLTSLESVSELPHLEVFDASDCPKLADLEPLGRCNKLVALELDACRRIGRLPGAISNTQVESIALTDCGNIASLRPLAGCDSLKRLKFVGDTTIVDGDLAVLEELPALQEVWFAARRHYSITREELASRLAKRRAIS